jgi:hypothetical protein
MVHSPNRAVAAYFVQWAVGRVPDHGALFDLVLGSWGEGSSAANRVLVTLDYRLTETGPAFMVVDSAGRSTDNPALAGQALTRADVVGRPIAEEAFPVADAVLEHDSRIAEVLGPYRMGHAPHKSWWRFWG